MLNLQKNSISNFSGGIYKPIQPWASSTKPWSFIKTITNLKKNSIEYPNTVEFKNGLAISYQFLGNTHTALGSSTKPWSFIKTITNLKKNSIRNIPIRSPLKTISPFPIANFWVIPIQLWASSTKPWSFIKTITNLNRNSIRNIPIRWNLKTDSPFPMPISGNTHTALGKLDKALEFYQNYNQLELELYQEYPNTVEFKNNLAISYSKLGETQAVLGKLDKALEFYEKSNQLKKELHNDYPKQVEFKNNLAVSFTKLGVFYTEYQPDSAKARTCFKEAKVLWEALVEQAPGILEYQRYLDLVNEDLKKLS
jgi:tetratricopeptide (TPR) repeat protein